MRRVAFSHRFLSAVPASPRQRLAPSPRQLFSSSASSAVANPLTIWRSSRIIGPTRPAPPSWMGCRSGRWCRGWCRGRPMRRREFRMSRSVRRGRRDMTALPQVRISRSRSPTNLSRRPAPLHRLLLGLSRPAWQWRGHDRATRPDAASFVSPGAIAQLRRTRIFTR